MIYLELGVIMRIVDKVFNIIFNSEKKDRKTINEKVSKLGIKTPGSQYRNLGLVLHFVRTRIQSKDLFDLWVKNNNLHDYLCDIEYDSRSYYGLTFSEMMETNELGYDFCRKVLDQIGITGELYVNDTCRVKNSCTMFFNILDLLDRRNDSLWNRIRQEICFPKYVKPKNTYVGKRIEYTPLKCSPICYPGSKKRLSMKILNLIENKIPHNGKFIEPFGGSGIVSILLRSKRKDVKIVLNDLYFPTYALHRVVKEEPSFLLEKIIREQPNQKTWKMYHSMLNQEKDLKTLAWMFYYVITYSFNQLGYSFSDKHHCENKLKVSKILNASHFLQDTEITNMDFRDCLQYDGFAYIDPVYYASMFSPNKYFYFHSMKHEDHVELSNLLHDRDSWLLSYDDHPEIRKLYKGYEIDSFVLNRSMGRRSRKFQEILLSNCS